MWIRTKNEWSGWNSINQGMNKNWIDGAGGTVWIKIWIRTKNGWNGWNIMNQDMNKNWMDGTGGI